MDEFERQLHLAKERYGRVYTATVHEEAFIFRALNRKEYENLLFWYEEADELEEAVCEAAVLYPLRIDWGRVGAGVPPFLHQEIIRASAFHDHSMIHYYIEQARKEVQSFHEQTILLIASALPQYRIEEIEEWPVEKLMRFMVRAEWIHRNVHHRTWLEMKEHEEKPSEETPPTPQELGWQLREQGLDPMLETNTGSKPPYVEFPFIGGSKVWEDERVFNLVRESVQRISRQQTVLPAAPAE